MKGDAIAGVVIVFVNLIGGLVLGVLTKGMTVGEAAKTYALLAIGDGLVSQIPALCIAVSAGLVVTRVASEDEGASLGGDIGTQFLGQPRALYVVGGLLVALAAMPGMPTVPFLALAIGAGLLARRLTKATARAQAAMKQAQEETGLTAAPAAPAAASAPPAPLPVGVIPVLVDLSPALTELAREDAARLTARDIPQLRDALFLDTGIRFPAVRVRQNAPGLAEGGYTIQVEEIPTGRGALDLGKVYTGASPNDLQLLSIASAPARDPLSGRQIAAVDAGELERLKGLGAPVKTPREMLLLHLAQVLRRNAPRFLGVQETQALLDGLEPSCPALVREASQKVPAPILTEVLRRLAEEQVSLRNLKAILEALCEPGVEGPPAVLAERARRALRRHLCHRFAPEGTLVTLLVDPAVEQALRQARDAQGPGRGGAFAGPRHGHRGRAEAGDARQRHGRGAGVARDPPGAAAAHRGDVSGRGGASPSPSSTRSWPSSRWAS